jgi:hypothetical protein
VARNIFYCGEELLIYHLKASEIIGLKDTEHESVFLPETVVSNFFWGDVSRLEIVGVLQAAFHPVSGWIWRENDRKIPVSSGHFTGMLRKMHWIRPFPTVHI